MNSQCIAYVTDENYFFPTAVSALQAKSKAAKLTDVVIIISEAFKERRMAEDFCRENRIILLDRSQFLAEKFEQIDRREFSGRVSVSAMGRLLLSELLPEHYQQVIYIDGDTQIVDSLLPLESIVVPPGKIVAAPDYLSIVERARGLEARQYFNSGVLKFNRADWIGPAAFDHFIAHGGHLHDQGALNAVAGNALIPMSSRWNFPKQFLHLAGQRPAIIHFMAHPKPWDGVFFPWSSKEARVYAEAVRSHPSLRAFVQKISLRRKLTYKLRSFRDRLAYSLRFVGLDPLEGELRRVVRDWHGDEALFNRQSARPSITQQAAVPVG